MPPVGAAAAAPGAAGADQRAPLSDDEVKATSAYKILMQFNSPKDIEVAVQGKEATRQGSGSGSGR